MTLKPAAITPSGFRCANRHVSDRTVPQMNGYRCRQCDSMDTEPLFTRDDLVEVARQASIRWDEAAAFYDADVLAAGLVAEMLGEVEG